MTSDAAKAIMFVDVCGSTTLYETEGDERAEAAINELMATLRPMVERAGGQPVKEIGDELMCVFDDGAACVACAVEIQTFRARTAALGGGGLDVKVGVNWGSVIARNDDYFGDAVNVAARTVALAKCEQILVTRAMTDQLEEGKGPQIRYLDTLPVKGKEGNIDIHEVVWRDNELTHIAPRRPKGTAEKHTLTLLHMGREYVTDTLAARELRIGRSDQMDIVIKDDLVSRHHATISASWGRFRLTDSSSNGTYAIIDGNHAYIRRDVAILTGSGEIRFGSPRGGDVLLVSYRIE